MLVRLGLGIVLLLLSSGTAQAQFAVCNISATPVVFGVYDVFDSFPLDSTGSIHITCFGWMTTVRVWLSKGNGPSVSQRQMQPVSFGESRLDYNLYLDAARTLIWGDPSPNSYSALLWLFFLNQDLNVYGRIRPAQDVSAGTYNDMVIATINF